MPDNEITETPIKPLRPDERRAQTDINFRLIAEHEARRHKEKTERLRMAREQAEGPN